MDLKNVTDLENYFADHFDTAIFPVLAEHYLFANDYDRALKVCEIGLKHHPYSAVGHFICARIYIANNRLQDAEKKLKQTIAIDSNFYNAYVLLATVQENLERAVSTIRRTYKKILKMDSRNTNAIDWLENQSTIHKVTLSPPDTEEKSEAQVDTEIPEKSPSPPKSKSKSDLIGLKISPEIATFTLVAVLKSQKLYDQALEVLAVMSTKENVNQDRIEKERAELMELYKEQQEN